MNFKPRFCRRYLLIVILFIWCLVLLVYSKELDSIVSELVTFKVDTSDRESHHDLVDEILTKDEKILIFPEERYAKLLSLIWLIFNKFFAWSLDDWEQSSRLFETFEDTITVQNDKEKQREDFGLRRFSFNVLTSDKIGPRRNLPDFRHKLCKNLSYPSPERLPNATIVIVYHNEALSVLIRMINSIFDRSPSKLIHEILLLDDWSDAG